MRLNYKRLGDYIQPINQRNVSLEVDTLLGVSIKKVLMPSIANTIGTDMSRYKIIKKNQFAYGPVTSRNGDKISIALLEEHDKALVSQAYTVFEIIDDEALNAEYLMMWFRRPEFDRYARFKSHGSARETFDWEELEDTELPIPSIAKQRAIVKEYNTIVNRIKLNETLNQKLEDTAQALYKYWFVDFEFPNADGKPYKSSGGEMVYNEELDMEIPEGWEAMRLDSLIRQICVAFVGSVDKFYCSKEIGVPMLRTTDIKLSGLSYKGLKYVTKEFHLKQKKSQLKKGDLLVARHGSNGMPVIFDGGFEANALNVIVIKPNEMMSSKMIFCFLNSEIALNHIRGSLGGSVQQVINTKKIADIILPYTDDFKIINPLSDKLNIIQSAIEKNRQVINGLESLKDLILSKMSKT